MVTVWKALFGKNSINPYRALRFFFNRYQKNQKFTVARNKIGLPSLQDYQYLPEKHIPINSCYTLASRMRKLNAIVVVDKYRIEKMDIYCSIFKVSSHFGIFLTNIARALNETDRQFSEIKAKRGASGW